MESFVQQIPDDSPSFISLVIKLICDLLMIFCPPLCYYTQALKFEKNKSSKGFSKTLCLLLLLSNILRIYFWLGKPFSMALFYQSILVVLIQLYLMHVYLKYQDNEERKNLPEKTFTEHIQNWKETLNPFKIWNWDYEIDYYKFIFFLFFSMLFICSIVGFKNTGFFELIGVISVSIEVFIEIPQIKEICVTKNAKNISAAMIFMWLIGDLFKTIYNIAYKSPLQIIFGCFFQICEDLTIIGQVLIYGDIEPIRALFKKHYKYLNVNDNEEENENNLPNSLNDDIIKQKNNIENNVDEQTNNANTQVYRQTENLENKIELEEN